jgi:hypothetical protein
MPDVNDDVFGYKRNPKPRGVFSTENSKLTFGDVNATNVEGYLVQNWNISYNQDVQEVFEIGSNRLYWVKGRPAGTGALGRIIGGKEVDSPGGSGTFFPQDAYDICQGGATMVLSASGGTCDTVGTNVDELLNKELNVTMSGCVITQIGFSMAIADVRLMENFTWRFAYLKMDDSGSVT